MREVKRKKRTSAIKRIRAKFGYGTKFEVLIFRSNRNIYAQLVDLMSGATKFTVSTLKKGNKKNVSNIESAEKLGEALAERCKKEKIKNPSFNRAERLFHGVVKAVADSFYKKLEG